MGTEMKSSAERLEALAKEYPGYIMELLAHVLDNDNLTVKYIPEDIKALFETPSGFAIDSGYLYDINIDYTGIQTIWVHCGNKDSADSVVSMAKGIPQARQHIHRHPPRWH